MSRKSEGRNPRAEQRQVEFWNQTFAVGQEVEVALDNGSVKLTHTTSKAELLGGHSAVIWLHGVAGCYSLYRVSPILGKEAA